jgi:hypothetical protein
VVATAESMRGTTMHVSPDNFEFGSPGGSKKYSLREAGHC